MTLNNSLVVVKNNFRFKSKYLTDEILPTLYKIQKVVEPTTKTYLIAGKKIKIIFYSIAIASKLSKAISHNEFTYEGESDLTIFTFDSTVFDIVPPWTIKQKYIEESFKDSEDFLGVYLYNEKTLNIYDKVSRTAYFWIDNPGDLTFWIIAAPFRTLFHWFFSKNNIHLVHGASVSYKDKSVLLTAKGGSGKSTTALHCLFNEMGYLGDDYVIVDNDESQVHSLFRSLKVSFKIIETFPVLSSMVYNAEQVNNKNEKAIVLLSEPFLNNIVKSSKLDAIFIPVIKKDSVTKITPATKLETMMAMVPTTIFQLSLTSHDKMAQLKSIVSKVPCYFLELGVDSHEVASTIKKFLSNEK